MSNLQDVSFSFERNTIAYIDRLNLQSIQVVDLVEGLPLPVPLKSELQQTWRITRQKLAFFRRELARADGELQEELETLHETLLPQVISYQVKMGAMMISDTCVDRTHLDQWKRIWSNFNLD